MRGCTQPLISSMTSCQWFRIVSDPIELPANKNEGMGVVNCEVCNTYGCVNIGLHNKK